jgi:hypothetical protein
VIFAVMPPSGTEGMGSGTWTVNFRRGKETPLAKIPSRWRSIVEGRTGFVYVLPRDTFEGYGGQLKSKVRVTPVDVVEVEFHDFEALGGVIEWVEVEKD